MYTMALRLFLLFTVSLVALSLKANTDEYATPSPLVNIVYTGPNKNFARDVAIDLSARGWPTNELINLDDGYTKGICYFSEHFISVDNRAYKKLNELCGDSSSFRHFGSFLYPSEDTVNDEILKKHSNVTFTTPGIGHNVFLALFNGYTEIGLVYSDKVNLMLAYKVLESLNLEDSIQLTPVKVHNENEAIKAIGRLSNQNQAIVLGFDPSIFSPKVISVAVKISIKTLTPLIGGQHQGLTSTGVIAGCYYPFESNFNAIQNWLKNHGSPSQKREIFVNEKLERFIGKKFVKPSENEPLKDLE